MKLRPTDIKRSPNDLRSILDRDQMRLYELIWNRTVASQMQVLNLNVQLLI